MKSWGIFASMVALGCAGVGINPNCPSTTAYNADNSTFSNGSCVPKTANCGYSTTPTPLPTACNVSCQKYWAAWYCSSKANCTNTCPWRNSSTSSLLVCQSSLQRLLDGCSGCGAFSGGVDSFAAANNVTVYDDSAYPVSRMCSYPGCKCTASASCLDNCTYTAVGCVNPFFQITPPSEAACWDFLSGLTDPVDTNFSAQSSVTYGYLLAQVCDAFGAADFKYYCSLYGYDPRSLDVTTSCGSVVAQVICRASTIAKADDLCKTLLATLTDPTTPLFNILRPQVIPATGTVPGKNDVWLWSLFALLPLALLLCGALWCCLQARKAHKNYTHFDQQPEQEEFEEHPYPTLSMMHPQERGLLWQHHAVPTALDESGEVQPYQHMVAYPQYAVAEGYVAHSGSRFPTTEAQAFRPGDINQ